MKDVVNAMLNDDSKDMRYHRIFIRDIEPCKWNQYPMHEIEQLAQNIAECGLLHPITLYKKSDDHYMILSGERRYRAMLYNYEHGDDRFEEVPAIVKVKELHETEIKRYIRRGNANRESLPKNIKLMIVQESFEDYEKLKAEGMIASGTLKRDWIAMDTGFSARSVQEYLNIINPIDKPKIVKSEDMIQYKNIQESMKKILKVPVKITQKQICIKIKNEQDLARIMEILGINQ